MVISHMLQSVVDIKEADPWYSTAEHNIIISCSLSYAQWKGEPTCVI